MSLTWFELPPPADLGDGWSLRFLTAAQMLESRGEGEAKASEERDKALWANAALLSRVLLKEGEPAFPSGEAVLENLTVGQIEGLTRRWWAQDAISGGAVQEMWPDQEMWTSRAQETDRMGQVVREQGENERFDMARFLELGGAANGTPREPMGGFAAVAPAAVSPVWPRSGIALQAPETVLKMYRGLSPDRGTVTPYGGGDLSEEVPFSSSGKTQEEMALPRAEHSTVRVLLPETGQAGTGVTIEELDRAVERDARRYDGGSTLY